MNKKSRKIKTIDLSKMSMYDAAKTVEKILYNRELKFEDKIIFKCMDLEEKIMNFIKQFFINIFNKVFKKEKRKENFLPDIRVSTLHETFQHLQNLGLWQYVTSYINGPVILYDKRNGELLEHHKGNEFSVAASVKSVKVTKDIVDKIKNSEKCYVYRAMKYKGKFNKVTKENENKNKEEGLLIRMFCWPQDAEKE